MTNKLPEAKYNEYDSMPWLETPELHTNGGASFASVEFDDIIIVIPKSKRAFKTKSNLDLILEFTKEVLNDK